MPVQAYNTLRLFSERLRFDANVELMDFYCCVFFYIGFEFSESEPSALVQRQGGPCAVIAPVQAYLLKTVLSETNSPNFSEVSISMQHASLEE